MTNDLRPSADQFPRTFRWTTVVGQSRSRSYGRETLIGRPHFLKQRTHPPSFRPSVTYENPLGRMDDRISQKTDGGSSIYDNVLGCRWMIRHPSSVGHPSSWSCRTLHIFVGTSFFPSFPSFHHLQSHSFRPNESWNKKHQTHIKHVQ
jgi:hypothetical protein